MQRLEIEIALRKANAEMCIVGMVITVLSAAAAAEKNASLSNTLSIRYVSPNCDRVGDSTYDALNSQIPKTKCFEDSTEEIMH